MKKLLVAATLAALSIGSANALTISSSFVNAEETTDIGTTTPYFGTLNYFDSNLGTLTGVSVSVTGALTTQINITNNAAQTVNANGRTNSDFFFSSSDATLDALLSALMFPTVQLQTGAQSIAVGDTYQSPTLHTSRTADLVPTPVSAFSKVGLNTFTVSCMTETASFTSGGGGNLPTSPTTTAGCGAAIVYTYDAAPQPPAQVPEPASMALIGLGALGLAAIRRRK